MKINKILLTAFICVAFIMSASSGAAAQDDFRMFWKNFKAAVVGGDKAAAARMTRFSLEMPAYQKGVKSRADFLRRYGRIFNGETDAARCFSLAAPEKRDEKTYEIYCPVKLAPDDWTNAPVKYYFVLTKNGWKFAGLDNINE